MAEELSHAIVLAAKRMETDEPPFEIATLNTFEDMAHGHQCSVVGVDGPQVIAFPTFEAAYNYLVRSGFVRMKSEDENHWHGLIQQMRKVGSSSTTQHKIRMVFFKPHPEEKTLGTEEGRIAAVRK
jgi:hypothetical protein